MHRNITLESWAGSQPMEHVFEGEWVIEPGHECKVCSADDLYNPDRTLAYAVAKTNDGSFVVVSINTDYLLKRKGWLTTAPSYWTPEQAHADAVDHAKDAASQPLRVESYNTYQRLEDLRDAVPARLAEEISAILSHGKELMEGR